MSYTRNIDGVMYIKPTHVPFTNSIDCHLAVKKHGSWLKAKDSQTYYQITKIRPTEGVELADRTCGYRFCFNNYVWADDLTPFGVPFEECNK